MNSIDIGHTLVVLACGLLPILACIAAGSVIGPARPALPRADMLVGFGILSSGLTIFAVITPIPLSWLMALLGLGSAVAALARRVFPGGRLTWIALALVLPVCVVAANRQPALWDDFWNWLPSAAYAYWHNSLSWPGLPPSLSIFPGYPQAMPLMIAAASFAGGQFLETAGPVINVLLLAGVSAVLAESFTATLVRHGTPIGEGIPPALVAGAVAITILLNPGLQGDVVLSSYAECGTMVAVGALGLLGVEILTQLSAPKPANVEALAWRFGFVGAMLINLKQANPALLALVVAGLILIALRHPLLRTRRAVLQLPKMLGPAIVVFVLWRWYVMHLPDSEQAFRPFEAWDWAALSDTFKSIGRHIAEAPLFHSLMWLVTAAGMVFFFQSPEKANEARWLAIVCAIVWLGYNVFLLTVYVGAVSASDAHGAADYWRYTPHVTLLGLYAPVMALAVKRFPIGIDLRSPALTLAATLVALGVLPLRGDISIAPGAAWQRFLRSAAVEMRPLIPAGSKVVIVSFSPDESLPFGVAIRYDLWRLDWPNPTIITTIRWDNRDLAAVTSEAARGEADFLIVQDAQGIKDQAADTLGLPKLDKELALFAWRNGAWERVKSWPIPPTLMQRNS